MKRTNISQFSMKNVSKEMIQFILLVQFQKTKIIPLMSQFLKQSQYKSIIIIFITLMEILENKFAPIKQSVIRCIQIANLNQSRYPFLPLTYTLWRTQKFSLYIESIPIEKQKQAILLFHREFDYTTLQIFKQKLKIATKNCVKQFQLPEMIKLKNIQQKGIHNQLIQEYCQEISQQLVNVELFLDLLSVPYTILTSQLQLKNNFRIQQKKQQPFLHKFIGKYGQNALFSGLTKIGTEAWGKIAIGFATIAGGVNIFGIAGGLAITKLFDILSQKFSESKQLENIRFQIQRFRRNKKFLQVRYLKCRILLTNYLQKQDEEQKNKIKCQFVEIVEDIFNYNYEAMIITKMENGWIDVNIPPEDEDEFVIIQKQEIEDVTELLQE